MDPRSRPEPSLDEQGELARLRSRVAELEETLAAIRSGEVDALIVNDSDGNEQLFTLSGPDTPYQVFVDHMGEGALTVDDDGTIVYSNARFADLTGTPLERVLGARLEEFVPEPHRAKLGSLFAERAGVHELELLHADGHFVPIRWSANSLNGGEDRSLWLVVSELGVQRHIEQLQRLIGALIDAMAEQDIHGALTVLTERVSSIIGAHQGVTCIALDRDGERTVCSTYVSEKYAQYGGRESLLASNEFRSGVGGQNPSVRMTQKELELEPLWKSVAHRKDRLPMRGWLAAPLVAADGTNLGLVQLSDKHAGDFTAYDEVIVHHIAQMAASVVRTKRAEALLHESQQRFRQLADSIPQLAWMTRADGHVSWYNQRWYEYTGKTAAEMEGWGWQSVLDPHDLPTVLERWQSSLASGEPFDIEFPIRGADGVLRPFFTLARPLRDESGRIVRWFGTNTDVSAQHRLMEERNQLLEAERAARTEAERASRMKDEFVATLSHELRTPLNAILGWSYMIARGQVAGEDLKKGLETIERNARIQVKMIEDLLDMSRITSGKMRLDFQQVDFDAVVDAAIASIRPAADAKRIQVVRRMRSRIDRVQGDPHRIQQIVWNILSNAIKFTAKGGTVTVAVESDDTHSRLRVTDDGIGIEPSFLPHVFDRFRQADGSTTRSYGGLGLGLAIVKQLVELHGGSIRAESEGSGHGSTFIVDLPLSPSGARHADDASDLRFRTFDGAKAKSPSRSMLEGLTVVYVDDESDARDLVARLLTDHGAKVLTAGSAADGRTLVGKELPDVLVSDIGMPIEDGYSLISTIRAMSREHGGETKAIAVTALARAEDRDRAIRAGFQTHLAKPVDTALLVTTIAQLAGRAVA